MILIVYIIDIYVHPFSDHYLNLFIAKIKKCKRNKKLKKEMGN